MGTEINMVLVWEDQPPLDDTGVRQSEALVFPGMEQLGHVLEHLCEGKILRQSNDETTWSLNWPIGGYAATYRDPMGFHIMKVTWSTNRFVGAGSLANIELLERSMIIFLQQLRPVFGFTTRYDTFGKSEAVQENVLIPLLANERINVDLEYHTILVGRPMEIAFSDHGAITHLSDAGMICRLEEHRNFFLDDGE